MRGTSELMEKIDRLERQLVFLRLELDGGRDAARLVSEKDITVLPCRFASQLVALREAEVVEVVMAARLEPLPDSPEWLRGVLNLRGEAVPVVDLAVRFGAAPRPLALSDRIVVVCERDRKAGLLLDEVEGVRVAPHDDLMAVPQGFFAARFVVALLKHGEQVLWLLDVAALLRPTLSELDAAREKSRLGQQVEHP